jgi:hypothetical protein
MFAHPISDPEGVDSGTTTDAPFTVGGSGFHGQPFTQVAYNRNYKHYYTLKNEKVLIEIE